MPWRETCQMDERTQFIARVLAGEDEMTALCREYGISRKTGYKWLRGDRCEGAAGLRERSHAPLRHRQAHQGAVVQPVLALRERWRHWGPKKLRVKLSEHHPALAVPAASTIGDWLRREGMVERSPRRRRCPPYARPFAAVTGANDVWCTDFKGWFRTGDGRRCDPFTLSDAHSRYLLRCQAVARPDEANVRPIFEAAFQEHGLPMAIRSDNGPPFASPGVGGLARLAGWGGMLGIRARADRCRQAAAEWPSRAGPSDAQARDCDAAGRQLAGAAAALRGVLRSLQPRAAARSAGATDTGLAVPALAAALPATA